MLMYHFQPDEIMDFHYLNVWITKMEHVNNDIIETFSNPQSRQKGKKSRTLQ